MIFTLTDRNFEVLDAYETDDYLIGTYTDSFLETLDINVSVKSLLAENWVQGNYIMCTDRSGKGRWFTIYDAEDASNDDTKALSCYSGTIDIVAEDAAPIKGTSQPFEWYFNAIFNDTNISLGINELAGQTRSLEYTSTDKSNAEMLQFVLNGFDNAEADFETQFDGTTPIKLVLNVYKRIGEIEVQAIISDEDDSLTSLERTGTISNLGTALKLTGKDDLTLVGKEYTERDSDGNLLYSSPKNDYRIYSLVGRDRFRVAMPGAIASDTSGYINRVYMSETSTQDALWAAGLAQLKAIDDVQITYKASGYIKCNRGDNVQVIANDMRPPVMISARVTEFKFNDDDITRNEYTISNFATLTSNINDLTEIIDEVKKSVRYIVDTVVDYQIGGAGPIAPTGEWSTTQPIAKPGDYLWTRTTQNMSDGTSVVGYSIGYIGTNGEQGPAGNDGVNGSDGIAGKDGVGIANTVIEYVGAVSGTSKPTSGWSTTIPTVSAGQYLWTRTTWQYTDGTSEQGFTNALMGRTGDKGATGPAGAKGDKGDTGATGPTGPKGDQGLPGIVYSQPTQPVTTQDGALWFKTASETDHKAIAIYTLKGTTWVESPIAGGAINVTDLSAISANLGTITTGILNAVTLNGAEINSPFDMAIDEAGLIWIKGNVKIANGVYAVTFQNYKKPTGAMLTKGSSTLTIDGQLISRLEDATGQPLYVSSFGYTGMTIADYGSGFSGTLSASMLTKTPWQNMTILSGYKVGDTATSTPTPQYRVVYNVDGTRTIRFRGAIAKTSGNFVNGSTQYPVKLPTTDYAPPGVVAKFGKGITSMTAAGENIRFAMIPAGDLNGNGGMIQFKVFGTPSYIYLDGFQYDLD